MTTLRETDNHKLSASPIALFGEAAGWRVEPVSNTQWRWSAWSNWSWAGRGISPEATGIVRSQRAAEKAGARAARSMNPAVFFQVQ